MAYEKGLSSEEKEELVWLVTHRSFKHVLGLIDEIVDRVQSEVINFPLTGGQNDAMLGLFGAKSRAMGALALKNALKAKIDTLRYTKEREIDND